MSEERCEGCGSTCVCCCTCDGDFVDDEEVICSSEGIPCPPFEEVRLEISPEPPPEPGAFARAAMGDEWTERTARQYAESRARWLNVDKAWFGEEHGWLTYDEAVAKGFRDG